MTTTKPKKFLKTTSFIILGLFILWVLPLKETSCPVNTPYSVQVAYEEQTPYNVNYDYEITKNECKKDFGGIFDIYAFHRIFILNKENQAGNFRVTSNIYTKLRGEKIQEKTVSIEPRSSAELEFSRDIDADEEISCQVNVIPPQKTAYRTETKYRTETRYQTQYVSKHVSILGGC